MPAAGTQADINRLQKEFCFGSRVREQGHGAANPKKDPFSSHIHYVVVNSNRCDVRHPFQ